MSALICEICKQSDFIKKDKYYICQCCGMKYSKDLILSLYNDSSIKKKSSKFESAKTTPKTAWCILGEKPYSVVKNPQRRCPKCGLTPIEQGRRSDEEYYKSMKKLENAIIRDYNNAIDWESGNWISDDDF